jgi:hypothetical protein
VASQSCPSWFYHTGRHHVDVNSGVDLLPWCLSLGSPVLVSRPARQLSQQTICLFAHACDVNGEVAGGGANCTPAFAALSRFSDAEHVMNINRVIARETETVIRKRTVRMREQLFGMMG